MSEERPPLAPSLDSAEFQRWYRMKQELVDFARQHGLRTTGDKPTLTTRVIAFLDGCPGQPFTATDSRRSTVSRRLPEPLTADTVLGPRQAASQQLRPFFVSTIGPRFSYDIRMRTFLASDRDKTLGEPGAWHQANWWMRRRRVPVWQAATAAHNRDSAGCLPPLG